MNILLKIEKNGKIFQKCNKITGLFIEEAMNTIDEENAMANYLGISKEEIRKLYGDKLTESIYQGSMAGAMKYLLENTSRDDFNKWRLYHDESYIEEIEKLMEKTEFWKHREEDIKPNSESRRNYARKQEILDNYQNPIAAEFFKSNKDVFFPDISKMTPIDKIDNTLEQFFCYRKKALLLYSISPENCSSLIEQIAHEIYPLINQTADLIKRKELEQMIGDVRIFSVNEITSETKEGIGLQIEELEQGEGNVI